MRKWRWQHAWCCFLGVALAGCAERPGVNPRVEFLKNARDEAAQIPAIKDRYRRQLNVAEAQISNYEYPQARLTLADAEATLRSVKPGEWDDRTVLAGWVSLSELYEKSTDWDARKEHPEQFISANEALNQAIVLLHEIQPESARSYYVRAIAREIHQLSYSEYSIHTVAEAWPSNEQIKLTAVQAINEAGPWADQMKEQAERRRAYRGFATDLLGGDDYQSASAMLQRDPDPAWRTDAAVLITNPPRRRRDYGIELNAPFSTDQLPYLKKLDGNEAAATTEPADDFGVPLDYESNFGEGSQ